MRPVVAADASAAALSKFDGGSRVRAKTLGTTVAGVRDFQDYSFDAVEAHGNNQKDN